MLNDASCRLYFIRLHPSVMITANRVMHDFELQVALYTVCVSFFCVCESRCGGGTFLVSRFSAW